MPVGSSRKGIKWAKPLTASPSHLAAVRERIELGKLVNLVQNHALNGGELERTQLDAAKMLIDKCMPSLSAVGGSDLMPPVQAAVVVKFGDGRD